MYTTTRQNTKSRLLILGFRIVNQNMEEDAWQAAYETHFVDKILYRQNAAMHL